MNTIGIRREDKNEWERRAPLTPTQVERLVMGHEIPIAVQPSTTRIYKDDEYVRAGAELRDDLSGCEMVMAVKEIPAELIRKGGAYIFFSHTFKGQESNRHLLRTFLEQGATLLDYEKGVDRKNRRLFFFGRQAGIVGAVESLRALGLRLKDEGHETPLLDIRPTYEYGTWADVQRAMEAVGARIAEEGFPAALGPVVIGITGDGHVSRGAREILRLLPSRAISPEILESLKPTSRRRTHEVHLATFREPDMVEPVDADAKFDLKEYYDHPDRYRSCLEPRLRPLTCLIHCSYWDDRYPPILTCEMMKNWLEDDDPMRLRVIGDLSCDPKGGIELNRHVTSPSAPFYVYDPIDDTITEGVVGRAPAILAVDHLPCMLPRSSSQSFGRVLESFVPVLARADFEAKTADEAGLPVAMRRAVLVWRGKLEPAYRRLEDLL